MNKNKKIRSKPRGKYHHGQLKSTLMDAALKHMQTTGSLDFTLRDIAKRAGVTHTSIYRHFPSKAYLLGAIAEDGFIRFKNSLDEATQNPKTDFVEKLTLQSEAYIKFAVNNPIHYKVMFSEDIKECMVLPTLAQSAQAAFMSLINLILEGVKAGTLKKKDPMEIALTVWSTTHGLSMLMLNGLLENAFQIDKGKTEHAAKIVSRYVHFGILNEI